MTAFKPMQCTAPPEVGYDASRLMARIDTKVRLAGGER